MYMCVCACCFQETNVFGKESAFTCSIDDKAKQLSSEQRLCDSIMREEQLEWRERSKVIPFQQHETLKDLSGNISDRSPPQTSLPTIRLVSKSSFPCVAVPDIVMIRKEHSSLEFDTFSRQVTSQKLCSTEIIEDSHQTVTTVASSMLNCTKKMPSSRNSISLQSETPSYVFVHTAPSVQLHEAKTISSVRKCKISVVSFHRLRCATRGFSAVKASTRVLKFSKKVRHFLSVYKMPLTCDLFVCTAVSLIERVSSFT